MNNNSSNKIRLAVLMLFIVMFARTDFLQSKTLFTLAPKTLSDTIPDIKVKIFPHCDYPRNKDTLP